MNTSDKSTVTQPDAAATVVKPKVSLRLAVALVLSGILWMTPYIGAVSVVLPALFDQIAPDQKVGMVATMSIAGSIVALIANILFGAFSDLTRSRFGARAPWLVLGSVMTAAMLFAITKTDNIVLILVLWCVFQFFLNAIVAPLVAVIPDRAPESQRGTYSAIYGVGSMVGSGLASIVASRFISNPQLGLIVFAVALLLCGPLFVVLAPDKSNKDKPRAKFSMDMIMTNFSFPTKHCRDFYLALFGKLLFVLAFYAITGYQLYIAQDYIGLDATAAGNLIAGMATMQLIFGLIFSAIAGPISDKVGRRKIFVIGCCLLSAAVFLIPAFWAASGAMIILAIVNSGIVMGAYMSVDQALNFDVLPNPETSAKDLGLLNMANTGGQIFGPMVTSFVVMSFGGYQPVFIISAVLMVISGLLIHLIRSSK